MNNKNIEERLVKLEVGRVYLEENITNINKNLSALNTKVDNHLLHLAKSMGGLNAKGWVMLLGYILSFATAVLMYIHK